MKYVSSTRESTVKSKILRRKKSKTISSPHALEHVKLKYVLYVLLVGLIGVSSLAIFKLTKPRNQKDVLGESSLGAWTVCLGQHENLTVAGGETSVIDTPNHQFRIRGNNDVLTWSGDVQVYDRKCKRIPAKQLSEGVQARYYQDDKGLVKVIELNN